MHVGCLVSVHYNFLGAASHHSVCAGAFSFFKKKEEKSGDALCGGTGRQ